MRSTPWKNPVASARRFLRSPRVIVAEMLLVAAFSLVATWIPQRGGAAGEMLAFSQRQPGLARLVLALGLDRVLEGPWFLALVGLVASSLLTVQIDQWRRLCRTWRNPAPGGGRTASYRRELVRPATGRSSSVTVVGRVGPVGSPVFHLGLLLVVLAGLLRMLLGSEAAVDLVEGETLPPGPAAYGRQWGGPLSAPFGLSTPLRFEGLLQARYPSGELQHLSARVTLGDRPLEVAVNSPLTAGWDRLYLSQRVGPAALLQIQHGETVEQVLLLLGRDEARPAAATHGLAPELRLELSAALGQDGSLPSEARVRLVRDGAAEGAIALRPGQTVSLGADTSVRLHAMRYWAQFRGSRDVAMWLAYLGFGLITLGLIVLFGVVRIDTLIEITPLDDQSEQVLVAMRPHRHASFYADRFEQLVREVAEGKEP